MIGRRVAASMAGALVLAASVAALFVPLAPRAAAAGSWSWTLTPTTLTQGIPVDITATITDSGAQIGTMVVKIPPGFSLRTASIASMPGGLNWTVSVSGSSPTKVTFAARTQADVLVSGQAVLTFRVTVSAPSPLPSWTATASTNIDGSGNAGSQTQPKPFTVIVPATPTPKPSGSPSPPGSPSPSGSPSPGTSAQPTKAVGTLKPGTTASPSPSATPTDTPEATPTPEPTPTPTPTPGLDVLPLPPGTSVSIDLSGMGNMAMFAWAVPVLFMGLPGLLLVLVVLIQACFAWFFIPVTMRVLGLNDRRRKRRKPSRSYPNA